MKGTAFLGPHRRPRTSGILVEDDPDQAELARRALLEAGLGLETVIAYDGRQALEYLLAEGAYRNRDAAVLPELILLDLKLPEIDGFQVLKRSGSTTRSAIYPSWFFPVATRRRIWRRAMSLAPMVTCENQSISENLSKQYERFAAPSHL